jgi:aminoglycoside phosphotransferase (APT) family kinase protein
MAKPDIDPTNLRLLLDRLFPEAGSVASERMRSGGSTQVYRLDRAGENLYLRFGEEAVDSFSPEAWVMQQLVERGARVPGVVLVEEFAPEVERSVMVTTEVPGEPLQIGGMGSDGADHLRREVLAAAGRDLALINSLPVAGFGFVNRRRPWTGPLAGSFSVFDEWLLSTTGAPFAAAESFSTSERWRIAEAIDHVKHETDPEQGWLAHGDFDTSHIFVDASAYTGIIDFGEIRGADRWYDLADFVLHSGGEIEGAAVTSLFTGYSEVRPLAGSDITSIRMRGVVLGIALLKRIAGRGLDWYERETIASMRRLLA